MLQQCLVCRYSVWIDPRVEMKDQGKPIWRWIAVVLLLMVLILTGAIRDTSWICLPQNKRGNLYPLALILGWAVGGLILHTSDLCLCVLFQVVWECEAAGGRAHTQGEMLISSQWGRLVWLEPEGMREGFWLARGGACCRNWYTVSRIALKNLEPLEYYLCWIHHLL